MKHKYTLWTNCKLIHMLQQVVEYIRAVPAFEGGKWGDRPRPRSWGGPALQA